MLKKTVAQFIPIILIFILLSSFRNLVAFSNTIIGKLLAVLIIIFYTYLDKILGIFVCAIVIFYYQTDVVENMLNMDADNGNLDTEYTTQYVGQEELTEILDDYVYLSTGEKVRKHKESMINYSSIDNEKDILLKNEKLEEEFRKESCLKGELVNKGVNIKYEMAEHVFPEIKFRRGACNPCLKTCDFSIIESKLSTENKLR